MPLQTVEPQRLYRQIAEQLRTLIAAASLPPGRACRPSATWPSSWA
jgi:DNA-binding GntR family transcriptional regulator